MANQIRRCVRGAITSSLAECGCTVAADSLKASDLDVRDSVSVCVGIGSFVGNLLSVIEHDPFAADDPVVVHCKSGHVLVHCHGECVLLLLGAVL